MPKMVSYQANMNQIMNYVDGLIYCIVYGEDYKISNIVKNVTFCACYPECEEWIEKDNEGVIEAIRKRHIRSKYKKEPKETTKAKTNRNTEWYKCNMWKCIVDLAV